MLIDGCSVGQVVRPTSAEEIAEVVRSSTGAIVPVGAGTQMEMGNPLRGADTVVDLRGMARITEYNPSDLTIHAEAGVTLGQLQQALAANNQTLALDPWGGEEMTLGGIVATNAQGPLRAVGTIRDWIIGMKVVHADGRISKTGGKVVKNVTGYDLAKLYTGSIGTLAIISEVSLKLRAGFGRTATVVAEFDRPDAALATAAAVRQSLVQPIACEIAGPRPIQLVMRLGENPQAVEWQLANLPQAAWKFYEGEKERTQWEALRARALAMGPIVVRAVGVPSFVGDTIKVYKPAAWIVHANNGIALMSAESGEEVIRLRERYRAVVEKAPLQVRRGLHAFGITGTEAKLIREMKRSLDPEGRLNPGKHLDGE